MLVDNRECQIQKVHSTGARGRFPFEGMVVVEPALEAGPGGGIGVGVGDDPDTEHVIDVSSEKEEVCTEFGEESVLPNGIVEGGIGGGWGGPHCTALNLVPGGVAEANDIVFHDDGQRVHQGLNGNVGKLGGITSEVPADFV